MGAGDDTTKTAANRLRLLTTEFTQPRRAAGSAAPPGRRTPIPAPAAPLDLGTLELVATSIREIIDHTRQADPDAGPPPADLGASYEWMRDHTAHLDDERVRVRDAMVERQSLQYALRMGDTKVIRQITCPSCHCWSLFWQPAREVAACVNRLCFTRGRGSVWTLAQLAEYQVDKRERGQRTAT